jgi:L-alanine-DL-glutamate epimerase-like enolase superfamily enzyme
MPRGTDSAPVIAGVETAVYTVPTDAPEADGTLSWDETTLVLVTVHGGGETGLGWSYASGAAKTVIDGTLSPVVTGRDAMGIQGIAEDMSRALRNIGRPGIGSNGVAPPSIALFLTFMT